MKNVFTYTDRVNYRGTCYLHLNAIAYVWTRNPQEALIYLIGREEPIDLRGDDAERFLALYNTDEKVQTSEVTTDELDRT